VIAAVEGSRRWCSTLRSGECPDALPAAACDLGNRVV
jgi:hypothetical protein